MARPPAWRRRPLLGLVLLLALVAAAYLLGTGGGGEGGGVGPSALSSSAGPSSGPASRPSVSGSDATRSTPAPAPATDPASGLPVVALTDLPPEAADTLGLIGTDGPFPYERDGAEFANREGLLPGQPGGWYREYTVPTPGEDDRGARRIVAGQDGATYYTGDHYDSFVVVALP